MILDFLPKKILDCIKKFDINKVYEIRIRVNEPLIINHNFEYIICGKDGKSIDLTDRIIILKEDIDRIIENVTEKSLYIYNEYIKQGFLPYKNGIRIGLCGHTIFDNDKIITMNNFSSINIRIPHLIKNCSKEIRKYIFNNNDNSIYNTLIVSNAFMGKTTILKDLIYFLDYKFDFPILIVDEREEFNGIVGKNIDKITNCDKNFAFKIALRTMSPRIIITDEIVTKDDFDYLKTAISTGVKIIATCHSDCVENLVIKPYFEKNIFDRIFFLKKCNEPGILEKVYNGDLKEI